MFRVYSTKEFPGLQASTELTKVKMSSLLCFCHRLNFFVCLKHLARWGVRLNIRETERRRRKGNKRRSASAEATEATESYISHNRKRKRSEGPL